MRWTKLQPFTSRLPKIITVVQSFTELFKK